MERPTRAHQRAAAIDLSPARLAAEILRLTKERDVARRAADAARKALEEVRADLAGERAGAESRAGELETAFRERDEFLVALQRERAEFQNFRRRSAEEREAARGLAADDLLRKVVALADDFDLAVDHRPAAIAADPWVEGIAAIDRKLRTLLESEGVVAIDASPGVRFDPRDHEAIVNVRGTGRADGEIVEELRRGYRVRDRVLRPSLVAVAESDDQPVPPPGMAGDGDAGSADDPDTDSSSSHRVH